MRAVQWKRSKTPLRSRETVFYGDTYSRVPVGFRRKQHTLSNITFHFIPSVYICIVAILLYILYIPVLPTDTSNELYAGIFRGCGNRIE
jgi:hypothetical protein